MCHKCYRDKSREKERRKKNISCFSAEWNSIGQSNNICFKWFTKLLVFVMQTGQEKGNARVNPIIRCTLVLSHTHCILQLSTTHQITKRLQEKDNSISRHYLLSTPTILHVPSLKLEPLITYSAATHFLIRVGWNYFSNRIKLLLWH